MLRYLTVSKDFTKMKLLKRLLACCHSEIIQKNLRRGLFRFESSNIRFLFRLPVISARLTLFAIRLPDMFHLR